jgi:hypothetical protein
MKDCPCHKTIGGPHWSAETCKKCGRKWNRYRGGSYDWEYRDCHECVVKEMLKIRTGPKPEIKPAQE